MRPAVSVPGSNGKRIEVDPRPASRQSSVSVSLTNASTCHSSPGPVDDTFDNLFGTAIETPGPLITSFEDSFMTGMPSKAEDNSDVEKFFESMIDFNTGTDGFVNLDEHDIHDQEPYNIFADHTQVFM